MFLLIADYDRGSIPAHAGKPPPGWMSSRRTRVYPRPRGETPPGIPGSGSGRGLSPPTRGNPSSVSLIRTRIGSIPAHAGKPWKTMLLWAMLVVYPRPRGETTFPSLSLKVASGLSPPTRGNLGHTDFSITSLGSIPAHAGKPMIARLTLLQIRVYPRPRGETVKARIAEWGEPGLSPPTRGNPLRWSTDGQSIGSIPAHAGKPAASFTDHALRRVYPRPRGETLDWPGRQ